MNQTYRTRSGNLDALVKTKNKKNTFSLSGLTRSFGGLLVLSSVMLVVVYIIEVNWVSVWGYRLDEQKTELTKLKESYNDLVLAEAELRQIEKVETAVEGLEMQKTADIQYVGTAEAVAKR
ncbi:MAG: hypothetical protein G01um101418_67 [Parcubacteria group bacterium Gr01-1014_18]|nr:MAG: hypothetical protein Greene041636_67 [Parcubacteria group bacterium Greene0416_36]TSC81573.1 MAG: hypothetical protein G01um101418_67 [Parcubacteria group bacterium Gr01-1014_18]TSC99616.1 MAG: hypothetical protein Greene101420_20 [Parcubacteria group bacterium Greene1014_20]TSD07067.1 MAG: hypothetical protein Greene07142_379 [Parcubacteria group bacterium Greene0714_2]